MIEPERCGQFKARPEFLRFQRAVECVSGRLRTDTFHGHGFDSMAHTVDIQPDLVPGADIGERRDFEIRIAGFGGNSGRESWPTPSKRVNERRRN